VTVAEPPRPGNATLAAFTAAINASVSGPSVPTLPGAEGPPTNVDADPLLEDVNGDGTFNVLDVADLLAALDSDAVQDNPERFDFNGDGTVNVVDVAELLEAV